MPTSALKIVFLVLLFSTSSLFSQEVFITGRLLNNENNEPIVFATIKLKDKAIGVISNLDGSFRIPEKFKELGTILEISSLAYETKAIELNRLTTDKTNIIRLDPAIELLEEVVVQGARRIRKPSQSGKRMSAALIVESAIKNIALNYPTTPFKAVGYYRDFQRNAKTYINLNEAIFEVWDQGFGALDHETTKIRVLENKRNLDFPIDSITERPYEYKGKRKIIPGAYLDNYGGNEFTILRLHDPIRNYSINAFDYVNVFRSDFLKNHYFKKENDVLLNNERLYNISFLRNKGQVLVTGNLIISRTNFAIYKMEYTIKSGYREKVKYSQRLSNYALPIDNIYNSGPKEFLFSVVVGYTPYEGYMYPNFHSMKNTFRVQEPPRFIVEQVKYSWAKKTFIISFNNRLNEKDAMKKSNYKVRYKGKKLNIDRIVHIEDQVLLYPNPKTANIVFEEIHKAQQNGKKGAEVINIKIGDIRDINGNYVDEPSYRKVRQYREFFVQRILTKPKAEPKDSLYMNKNVPIFKDQPISRSLDFSDYWMNTPLPNIEE